MKVYRLMRMKYGLELSGAGAAKGNARWNSYGVQMIYTAESRALAMAEVAVYLRLSSIPRDYMMVTIDIPSAVKIHTYPEHRLPEGWDAFPHTEVSRRIGDRFVWDKKYAVLKVPSVVVPGDANYLIDPTHPDFKKIGISGSTPFEFDSRMIR